jgi:hypothetical protein
MAARPHPPSPPLSLQQAQGSPWAATVSGIKGLPVLKYAIKDQLVAGRFVLALDAWKDCDINIGYILAARKTEDNAGAYGECRL